MKCPAADTDTAPAPASRPTTKPADDTAADPRLAKILKSWTDLADREASVREAARYALMGLSPRDLPVLRRVVADNRPVMPAQAVVLREIVTQVLLSGEEYVTDGREGFLGVRPCEINMTVHAQPPAAVVPFPNADLPGADPDAIIGVAIMERMPGFCGARALKDGDVILGIVERPAVAFRNPSEFSQAVRFMGAGQAIHFQILRQGQVIRVPITLDPLPEAARLIPGGPHSMDQLVEEREHKAKEYWDEEFAPLLKEGVG